MIRMPYASKHRREMWRGFTPRNVFRVDMRRNVSIVYTFDFGLICTCCVSFLFCSLTIKPPTTYCIKLPSKQNLLLVASLAVNTNVLFTFRYRFYCWLNNRFSLRFILSLFVSPSALSMANTHQIVPTSIDKAIRRLVNF